MKAPPGLGGARGTVALAGAGGPLLEVLSRSFADAGEVVLVMAGSSPDEIDRRLRRVPQLRAAVLVGDIASCGDFSDDLEFNDLRRHLCGLARRIRVLARRMVAQRGGSIVGVFPHPVSPAPPGTAACEAASALIRAAAWDLRHYGVSLCGVVTTSGTTTARDAAPGAVSPLTVVAQLARVLTAGEAAAVGEVYVVTGTALGRLAPPSAERELVRSSRRLAVREVAVALAPGQDEFAPGRDESGPGQDGFAPGRQAVGVAPERQGAPGPARPREAGAGMLAGRVAIVTGGAGGIGRAAAHALAEEGAAVVVTDLGCDATGNGRDPGPAEAVARDITRQGGRAVAVCADVVQPGECRDLVARTLRTFGRVDALCHAAGILRPALIFELTDDEWDAVFDVHVVGARNLVRSCLEPMRQQGHGRIVLFSSRSVTGTPGHAGYAMSKAVTLALGRSLAGVVEADGIRVNIVFPSGRTRATQPGPASARLRRIELLRARHHGITDPAAYRNAPEQDPENNAAMLTWLCSEQSREMNGRIIATGGWSVVQYRSSAVAKSFALPDAVALADVLALSTS